MFPLSYSDNDDTERINDSSSTSNRKRQPTPKKRNNQEASSANNLHEEIKQGQHGDNEAVRENHSIDFRGTFQPYNVW